MPKTAALKPTTAKSGAVAKNGSAARAGSINGAVSVMLICLLALLQGGYYAGATCAIALIAIAGRLIWVVTHGENMPVSSPTLLLLVIASFYLASAFAHGATATMLLESATWFAIAGASLWCCGMSGSQKREALEMLAYAGVLLASLGVLMFAGVLPLEGVVSAGRLMFTYQYANTAGLFFGIISVLCLCVLRGRRRALAFIPVVALALTRSGGALAVFLLALVAVAVRWIRIERPQRYAKVSMGVLAVVACASVIALICSRASQVVGTFTERVVQVLDALSLLMGNLLLGIGPDVWQITFSVVQTAQYRAANVHCSYMQVALDGGVLALAALVALFAVGFVGLVRDGDFPSFVCLAMIAAHSLVDFDLQFSSITLLAVLLAFSPSDSAVVARFCKPPSRARMAFAWVVAICGIACAVGGVYVDARAGMVRDAAQTDGAQALAAIESAPFLRDDPLIRESVEAALYAQGDYASVVALASDVAIAENMAASSNACVGEGEQLYLAFAELALGDAEGGRTAFAHALHARPYDVGLYEVAKAYVEGIEPGETHNSLAALFNEEAARANELARVGHAAWLSNQEEVELVG